VLAVVPVLLYWFFESPVRMVVAGGVAQAMMLPLIGFAAIYVRHTQLPRDLQPALATTVMLWLSTAVMLGFALYYVGSNVF
jgi:manganese transport protein